MPILELPILAVIWLRLILGVLFIFSSVMKMPDPNGFVAIFAQYKIVPSRLVRPAALGLIAFELVAGIFLLVGGPVLFLGAVMVLLHLFVSTYGVTHAFLNRNMMPNCGCYGTTLKVPISAKKIAENIGWITLAALLVLSV